MHHQRKRKRSQVSQCPDLKGIVITVRPLARERDTLAQILRTVRQVTLTQIIHHSDENKNLVNQP